MSLWGKRADMVVHGVDPFNAEPRPEQLAQGVITALDSFYSRNHGPIPEVDATAWRLRVGGLVDRELSLSLADLQSGFATRSVVVTLQCAGNRRAELVEVRDIPGEDPWGPCATSTARWAGVALADVLEAAGVGEGAREVVFAAPDVSQIAEPPQAYGGSIGLSKAMAGEVLLAWGMNGEPLPAVHGGPLRVVVPGYIGARSVKWLERITVSDEPSSNYFQATAYRLLPAEADPSAAVPGDGLSLGAVAVNSAILRPADGAAVSPGPIEVQGYAFAGDDRGIARVDVSADGGASWVQADLGQSSGPWAWRMWAATVDVPPGATGLVARAWDTSAASQPESPVHLWNPKGYVNNAWARTRLTTAP